MELKQKLYQMFILGTDGDGYKEALKKNLGGIIFFTKDIQTQKQFKALCDEIKANATTAPFLSIDQEGGRVERTENLHQGKKYLSAKYAYEKGEAFLKEQTQNIANELKFYGINMNFAPCMDVNTNPDNPIIGERAFANNPQDVIIGGKLVAQIYRENSIIPCAKHFPGHGDASTDSHLTLPEINLSLEDMENQHIKPFKAAIEDGIETIMIAHLHCPCFETAIIPSSLSKKTISYLRNELNYNGLTISDDMIMKGVSKFGPTEACEMGIRAGLNMFIYRNSTKETLNIIENIAKKAQNDQELKNNIEISYNKIIELKTKYKIL